MHKGTKYAEAVRIFILTLRFYSPRAYEYVRLKFDKNLPHSATIRKWYQRSTVRCESGICQRSIELLKDFVRQLNEQNEVLYAGLVHDEMSLRQHAEWQNSKKKFSGFITFGKVAEDAETLPLATQVLVFLLSGINIPFNLPIAYYFISSLEGIDKVVLMSSIIKTLTEIGVKVLTTTSDGFATNIVAYEMFGCSFDLQNFNPQFTNPYDDTITVYPFLDPPHMLKLVRNVLSNRQKIYDRFGRAIEWRYFEQLVEVKNKENFITHKMTKDHIDFKRHEMRVRLAAQTFSKSVAQSMKSLMDRNHPGFEGASATIEFSQRMDTLFDILNSDIGHRDNIYKNAITEETSAEILSFLDDTTNYIQLLSFQPFSELILESELRVGFKGMLISIRNLKAIYLRLVKTKILDRFPVRRICQCPLESFFGRCRSHSFLGSNTNPTVSQFQSLVSKLLVNNEITSSIFANCTDQLDILQLSSGIPTSNSMGSVNQLQQSQQQRESEVQQLLGEEEDEMNIAVSISSNQEIGIAYVAGQIESKLEKLCPLYTSVFRDNDKIIIDSYPVMKDNRVPCRSTYEICALSHQILEPQLLKTDFNYTTIMDDTLTQIDCNSIFPKSALNLHTENDKSTLIKLIVDKYVEFRAYYVARKVTLENRAKRAEKKKHSLIKHFQGV